MDWKVVAAAPLVIENQLPVKGTYLVWETPRVQLLLQSSSSSPAMPSFTYALHGALFVMSIVIIHICLLWHPRCVLHRGLKILLHAFTPEHAQAQADVRQCRHESFMFIWSMIANAYSTMHGPAT